MKAEKLQALFCILIQKFSLFRKATFSRCFLGSGIAPGVKIVYTRSHPNRSAGPGRRNSGGLLHLTQKRGCFYADGARDHHPGGSDRSVCPGGGLDLQKWRLEGRRLRRQLRLLPPALRIPPDNGQRSPSDLTPQAPARLNRTSKNGQ